MAKALQIKLLAGILAVLCLIASLLVRASRPVSFTTEDRAYAQKMQQKAMPSAKPYLVP